MRWLETWSNNLKVRVTLFASLLWTVTWFVAAIAFWTPHPTKAVVIFALGFALPMLEIPVWAVILLSVLSRPGAWNTPRGRTVRRRQGRLS